MAEQPHILFVDDDPSVLAGLKTVVRKQYRVEAVTSGADALNICEKPKIYQSLFLICKCPK